MIVASVKQLTFVAVWIAFARRPNVLEPVPRCGEYPIDTGHKGSAEDAHEQHKG